MLLQTPLSVVDVSHLIYIVILSCGGRGEDKSKTLSTVRQRRLKKRLLTKRCRRELADNSAHARRDRHNCNTSVVDNIQDRAL